MELSRALRFRRRLEMKLADFGLPEIPLLGRYHHTRAERELPEHTHGDILEICFLVKGRQTYRVGGREYQLRGGDVFVAFPHERHSSAGNPQEKGVLYWMMVRRTRRGLPGLSGGQSRTLWRELCGMKFRHFRGSWRMRPQLDAMTALAQGPAFPLRQARLESEVLAFLLEVVRCSAVAGPRAAPARRMETLVRYIEANLDEALNVPHLAEVAGLSVPRFKAWFKEENGMPPAEYVLRAKVNVARQQLMLGKRSVTEIAFALNFSSSQYFATVFKRFTGKTPREILGPAAP